MARKTLRNAINSLLKPAGIRVVGADWGPRGFASAFARLRRMGFAPECIVDIGASDGAWTRECLRIFPSARYLLVDALEENRSALEKLRAAHRNVSYWIGALGRAPGRRSFHLHGDQSSFLSSEYAESGRVREIAVQTLDALIAEQQLPAPQLIKADVQGYELEVLAGGAEALKGAECVLLEVSYRRAYAGAPLADQVIAEMGRSGFRIYDICTYAQRPHDRELFQSDVLFAKSTSKVFAYEGYA
jgi:FkbM family methyltransferase